MPNHPARALKEKLKRGDTAFGFWITLESPSITEIVCRMGMDWLVIDAEHNHLDFKPTMEHIRIANLSGTACFVHVAEIQSGLIGRMLEMGADGVILPQVRSAADVARGVRSAKYPPLGTRGMAAERATKWGRGMVEYVKRANADTMVLPMVETAEAALALGEILDLPGIDAILFGPADFSSSCGFPGEWEGPGVAERILGLQKQIQARGIPCAILARDPQDALRRKNEKFQMIGLGSDTGSLIRSVAESFAAVGAEVAPAAWR